VEKIAGAFDAESQRAELKVTCAGAPPRPEFEAALEQVAPGTKLLDIVWDSGSARPKSNR
jgi:hypothetical protein